MEATKTKSRPLVTPVRNASAAVLQTVSRKYAASSGEDRKSSIQRSLQRDRQNSGRSFKKPAVSHAFRLLYRLMVLLAALGYVGVSLKASADALVLLREKDGQVVSNGRAASELLERYIGTTALRASPFVVEIIRNDTSPRKNATIYVSSSAGVSFDACDAMTPGTEALYAPVYMRKLYAAMARDTASNLTFLGANITELIVPIVDCDSSSVCKGIESRGVYNFLVRSKTNLDDVGIVAVNFATQSCRVPRQRKSGPAGLGTVTFINDLRADSVPCHYIVSVGYPHEVFNFHVFAQGIAIGTRSGFFVDSESTQAIFMEPWLISSNPIEAVTGIEWVSHPGMLDAWVHLTHLLFGIDLLSLIVLVLVPYRNLMNKNLWIGDAFATVSSRTTLRGLLVLVSWDVNGFWSLFEFCIYEGNEISKSATMEIHEWIIYADLLTLYFFICGVLGMLFRERVDPLLALLSFTLGFRYRVAIQSWSPSVVAAIGEFSAEFYNRGMWPRIEDKAKISPMRFWALHKLTVLPSTIAFSTLAPVFSTLSFVAAYVIFQKLRRRWIP